MRLTTTEERVYCPRCDEVTLHTAGAVRPEQLRCFACGHYDGTPADAPVPASAYRAERTGWEAMPYWPETRREPLRTELPVRTLSPQEAATLDPKDQHLAKAERRAARRRARKLGGTS